MVLGIDASSIRSGGGLTHLVELLRHAEPAKFGFSKVVIWSSSATLNRIGHQEWLIKKSHPLLQRSVPFMVFWQRAILRKALCNEQCDILLTTCATDGGFRPTVSMCQNLLPFEAEEANRYGASWMRLRLRILTITQSKSFRNSVGVIFLSEYSKNTVSKLLKLHVTSPVIPHGVNEMFFKGVSRQYGTEIGTKIITYVSIIDEYKHQWQVAQAVVELAKAGYKIRLKLIGTAYRPALRKLKMVLDREKEYEDIVEFEGAVDYVKLPDIYASSDIIVFASTCETFGMILLEAMASGRPIACSNRSSMPEILAGAGIYFDPLDVESIKNAIQYLCTNEKKAEILGAMARERARSYSWKKCSDSTFSYLSKTAQISFS
jgi:glycosyltransferase involved in cell wall biosynthesis